MVCSYCRTENTDEASFCVNCGHILEGRPRMIVVKEAEYTDLKQGYNRLVDLSKKLSELPLKVEEYKSIIIKQKKTIRRLKGVFYPLSIILIGICLYIFWKSHEELSVITENVNYYIFTSNRNYNEAVKWYQKAVENKTTYAPNDTLGYMFWGGDINYDFIPNYQRAAEQGNAFAQYTMAKLCTKGYEIGDKYYDKDTIKALDWLNKCITELYYTPAIAEIGLINIQKGDFDNAVKMWTAAANLRYAPAEEAMGLISSYDKKLMFDWYSKSAKQGYHLGQYHLAKCYEEGDGVKQDNSMAKEWYLKAAKQGNCDAQVHLVYIYDNEGNKEAVYKWSLKAAEQLDERGQLYLGKVYKYGIHVEKDTEKAIELFQKSAAQGNQEAEKELLELSTNKINAAKETDESNGDTIGFIRKIKHRIARWLMDE